MDVLPGISPKTLSDTLKELEAKGLIKRESFAEIPPRVVYTLANEGI
jgi:DNA-binding HxlR family transcriptional regulator